VAGVVGDDRRREAPPRVLFTAGQAAVWTGARLEGDAGAVVTGVEVDSRLVRPGDLFAALPGERTDGHLYVGKAFDAGAVAALVSQSPEGGLPPGKALLHVGDVLRALGTLAARHRERFRLPVVGITGSVGKTTTKDLVAAALGSFFRVLANRGNLNTDIGLPLTLFELGPEHEVACLEMGMRGPGEIARLAELARPTVGVLTTVGPVHIERLGSLEAIAAAKEELLWALPADGVAVLNADDPRVAAMGARHRDRLRSVVTYGLEQPALVAAVDVDPGGDDGRASFRVTVAPGSGLPTAGEARFTVPLAGRHSVSNALAAVAVGLVLGVPPEALRAGLDQARLSGMRQEVSVVAGVRVVNDAYNAGPASMAAAIDLLRAFRASRGGRAVAVLGDMLELGDLSEAAHRELGELIARVGLDYLFACGRWAEVTVKAARSGGLGAERARHFAGGTAKEDAARAALEVLRPGDTVLVKASRGMRFEDVVEMLLASLGRRAGGARGEGESR